MSTAQVGAVVGRARLRIADAVRAVRRLARIAAAAWTATARTATDRTATDRTATDRTATDRTATDRTATDRTATALPFEADSNPE